MSACKTFKETWIAVTLALVALGLFYSFATYLDQPEVHRDWPTGECVKVVDPAADRMGRKPYTCDRLPDAYETVWVGR